nr:anti-sigma factor [Oceanococcus sp. HetDA_MAG_MS8]
MMLADLNDRQLELLLADADGQLDALQQAELKALLADHPHLANQWEDLICQYLQASAPTVEPLPELLHARLSKQADAFFAEHQPAAVEPHTPKIKPEPARRSASGLWPLAFAASVLIAALGWYPQLQQQAPINPAAIHAELLAEGAIQVAWSPTDDPASLPAESGDIVWDPRRQKGVMRFTGLKPNDPRAEQYQLWIFDANRELHPVDGGVFNINDQGEAYVAFEAKLPVGQAHLFAVTVERPGGVVVSDQGRIAVVAKVG